MADDAGGGGDGGGTGEEEPLLVSDDSDAWNAIEDGTNAAAPALTVRQLIARDPDHVIAFLAKRGVAKLGSFKVPDALMLAALDGEPFLTMGAPQRDIDAEPAWRRFLELRPGGGRRPTGWSRAVTVEAFVVNLRDAAAADVEGLVNPLLQRYHAGGLHWSAFGLPAVQAVLAFKWQTFARTWVRRELAAFLAWLAFFSAFLLLFQDEDVSLTLPQLVATPWGAATVACEALALLAMAPFLLVELGSVVAYRGGWVSLWNVLDVATYALQLAIACMHLGRVNLASSALSVLVAFQCVLLWFRLNYFSRVFGGASSFSIIDSMQKVVVDIRFYLLYLLAMMWGFACAYCVLFRRDQGEHPQFADIGHAMLTMFTYALGGVDLDVAAGSTNPEASMVLSLLYQFGVATLLMSLLTGAMAQSLYKATAHEDLKRLLGKAQAIDELEATIPKWVERLMPANYPAYVHVLRIDPEAADDAVDGEALWHQPQQQQQQQGGGGGGGGKGAGAAGGDATALRALLGEVRDLRAQVQQLSELLHTAVPSAPPSPDAASSRLMASP